MRAKCCWLTEVLRISQVLSLELYNSSISTRRIEGPAICSRTMNMLSSRLSKMLYFAVAGRHQKCAWAAAPCAFSRCHTCQLRTLRSASNCDSALRVKYMYVTSLYLRCMRCDSWNTLPERVDQLRALVILEVPPAASSAGTKVGITPKGLKRQPEGRECGHQAKEAEGAKSAETRHIIEQ